MHVYVSMWLGCWARCCIDSWISLVEPSCTRTVSNSSLEYYWVVLAPGDIAFEGYLLCQPGTAPSPPACVRAHMGGLAPVCLGLPHSRRGHTQG